MGSRIFFNSLSTPLFVSERMPEDRQEDVLFWQEDARDDIPGNMQKILSGQSKRTKSIYVQKRESYDRLIQLGASKDVLKPLGFIYEFSRKNTYQNEALICTFCVKIRFAEPLSILTEKGPGIYGAIFVIVVTEPDRGCHLSLSISLRRFPNRKSGESKIF